MLILGIETSCDDTAAAVVEDGFNVLSSIVSSQDSIHGRYGGIVPELASRRHIEAIVPVVEEALERAGVALNDVDGVAVTQGPGLVGSILVGLSFAKAVAYVRGLPFVGVDHIEAHAMTAFLKEGKDASMETPEFPFVSMVVSGGHTTLLLFTGPTEYKVIGETLDDAAGEAFDKVAKLLGLGYPGGFAIDALAKRGNPGYAVFPRPYISKGSLDFSFSGIKTAVLNHVRGFNDKNGVPAGLLPDIAASFQEAVVDALVAKALWALESTGASNLVVSGGVACNSRLRARLKEAASGEGMRLFIPPPYFCSDNGAMVASTGFHLLKRGMNMGTLSMNALPHW